MLVVLYDLCCLKSWWLGLWWTGNGQTCEDMMIKVFHQKGCCFILVLVSLYDLWPNGLAGDEQGMAREDDDDEWHYKGKRNNQILPNIWYCQGYWHSGPGVHNANVLKVCSWVFIRLHVSWRKVRKGTKSKWLKKINHVSPTISFIKSKNGQIPC